jgi:SAM-dependent methyltransferase
MKLQDHNRVVRESFTTQASAFAANPWVSDEERIGRLISAANLNGCERVLDVATGPGYIAEAFARMAAEVVGVDLTEAMLRIARERVQSRGLKNVSFRLGDAKSLPYGEGEFDVVVTRFSLHHFPEPREALREMARVCRADGRIVVQDILTSEHPERAALHNEIEILRDPSHVRAMPLSELLVLFRDAGLEPQSVLISDDLALEVEQWLATTETPPEKAETIRNFFREEMTRDRSGLRPYQDATGKLHFRLRTAIVTGQKFRG